MDDNADEDLTPKLTHPLFGAIHKLRSQARGEGGWPNDYEKLRRG